MCVASREAAMRAPTYAQTFNKFYAVVTKRNSVRTWVRNVTRSRRRLSSRMRVTRHLLLIRDTQHTGVHIDTQTHVSLVRMHRTLTLGWILYYLRPLQRRVIQYLWRPGGPLYTRHRDALITTMRDVGLVHRETTE